MSSVEGQDQRRGQILSEDEVSSKTAEQISKNKRNYTNWKMKAFDDWWKSRLTKNVINPNRLQVLCEPEESDKE